MILSLLAFILAALVLFLSSQALLTCLFRLLPLNLAFFLLLPGIFLHEFSHILMAEVLLVKTGELKLKPELINGNLHLGSAQIALTDPLRLTLIGVAPFLGGTVTLWLVLNYGFGDFVWYWKILSGYLLFAISNTLFSSASDLQAAAVPLILVILLLGLFSLTNLNLPPTLIPFLQDFFFNLSKLFSYTFVLNFVLLLPLKFLPGLKHD